jgi:carbamate kinase
MAQHVDADLLVIATDVEAAVSGYGTDHAEPIGEVSAARMRAIAEAEHFAAGSMGPKVEAVTRFVERTGGTGVITSLHSLADAVEGRTGTRVVPDGGG